MASRLVSGLTWSRGLTILFIASMVWTVSIFVAPYTLTADSVSALSYQGSSNRIDNAQAYESFNPFAQAVYYLSDIQCHQLPYRSMSLNGNQMPLDARMVSIYVFANFGLLAAALVRPAGTVSQGIVNILPERGRRWVRDHSRVDVIAFLIVLATLMPVAVDGFTQLFGWRESTNVLRVFTGLFTGFGGGLLVGVMATSMKQFELEVRAFREAQRAGRSPERF